MCFIIFDYAKLFYFYLFFFLTNCIYRPDPPAIREQHFLHLLLLLQQRFMTQSRQNATSCYSDKLNLADQVELFSTVPTSAGGIGPLIEKRRIRNKLISEMKLSPMSSITGANYDEGEESFRHGRSQTVDSETRGSSYTWCQDFLSGFWKTLNEDNFQISIVR